jgi:Holliday junction resolvase RusA-like endonuclease
MVDQKKCNDSKDSPICSCGSRELKTSKGSVSLPEQSEVVSEHSDVPRSSDNSTTYVILGAPAPWSRAAPNFQNRKIYDTQKNLKLIVGIELTKQHNDRPLFEGPLHIDWCFYLEIPASYRSKKVSGKPHAFKPDISNLIKFYEDVANKIIFKDDCQIATGTWKKVYDELPRTEFTIRKISSR